MRKHNGMRPHDILILLKISLWESKEWRNIDLAFSLKISPGEITNALERCRIARLIDSKKKRVHRNALKEFIIYGLKYVFPVVPGSMVRGIPTAHSASPVKELIVTGQDVYVWPYVKGSVRGLEIEPLNKFVPEAALEDPDLYELLVLVDAIRIGRTREVKIAIEELEKRLSYE